jgi:hypothetical protein
VLPVPAVLDIAGTLLHHIFVGTVKRGIGMRMAGMAGGLAALLALTGWGGSAAAQQRTLTVAAHHTAEQMRPLDACFRE